MNEGTIFKGDVLIEENTITGVSEHIAQKNAETTVINADGRYLIPGFIDDQVHFREPGLTHKATIASESRAAVAGGVTSFIEMPNTVPNTTTIERLDQKFEIAKHSSWANYSFMFGGTNDNLAEIEKVNTKTVAGLKLFLGSSTGNMLVDDPKTLEKIFRRTKMIISVHCEDEATVQANLQKYKAQYGDAIPMAKHPEIRSAGSCYISSSKAIGLAKKTGARLHVFHLSTEKEMHLFDNTKPLKDKKITAEVCTHHLWFTAADYAQKGSQIKWNPAVKTANDRAALREALLDDRLDILATDHAPHTWDEKNQVYTKAPSGGPLVQHTVAAMFDLFLEGVLPLEKIIEKAAHNPAILFNIKDRGYIKPGYRADLALVHPASPWTVNKQNLLYKCGWSPFEGHTFKARVTHTWVNGVLAYENGTFPNRSHGERLQFDR